MNALIPVFVAVLLAEVGGPLSVFARGPGRGRRNVAALAMAILIVVAAAGGWTVGSIMIAPAKSLMLGLALLFGGLAQFGKRACATVTPTIIAGAIMLYRSPASFLAFAFALWMNAPISAAAGAMLGLGAAAIIGTQVYKTPRSIGISSGIILCLAGIFAVLNGLRLV